MTEYHVEYRIEVDAESPEEAARKVAAILGGGGAGRGVYHVAETGRLDCVEEVDLSRLECNGCKRPAAEVEDGLLGYGEHGDLCYECYMRANDYVECPQCDQWVQVNEVETYQTPNGPVRMCSGCHHDARRSGADIS